MERSSSSAATTACASSILSAPRIACACWRAEVEIDSLLALYAIGGLSVIALAEAVVIVRVSKALKAVTRFGERLAHLASAMELLTDTTEAGLTNVGVALERSAPQRAARSTRGAT